MKLGLWPGPVGVSRPIVAAPPASWWLAGGISASACKIAYQPKGAASLAASYSNLANPGTNDAAPGTAPTWNSTDGWIFNGTTQYLTTGLIPSATWTTLIRFSNCTDNGYIFGVFETTPGYALAPRKTLNTSARYYGGSASDVAPHATSGVMGIAHNKGVRDKVFEGAPSGNGTYTRGMYVGAVNERGALYECCAAYVQAFAVYDYKLLQAELDAVTDAMNAL